MKKIIPVIAVTLIISITATYWISTTSFSARPLTQAEVALLSPDWADATGGNWSPWHTQADGTEEWNPTASFNAWVGAIPEHDKAWPIIARVLLDHEDLRSHQWLGAEPHETENWNQTFLLFYNAESRTAIDDLAKAMHAPFLGIVDREGTDPVTHQLMIDRGMEDLDWIEQPSENPGPWLNITGHFSELRVVANLLSTAAYSALESESDSERFVDLVWAMFDGADHSLTRTRMIDHLMYFAAYRKALGVVEWALVYHSDQFDETDLAELDMFLDAFPPRSFEATDETLGLHDHYRRLVNRNGKLDFDRAIDADDSWAMPEFTMPSNQSITQLDPRLQQLILYQSRQFNKIARKSSLPWDGTELAYEDFREGFGLVPSRFHETVMQSEFSITYWELNLDLQLRARALRIAIAAERHKRKHGEYPQSLGQIDTDFIHFEINDPFTNEPLLYELSDAGPVIYSAGTDRDDDNGTPMRSLYINPNYAQIGSSLMSGTTGAISRLPHWISQEQAEQISDQSLIDGDWILYSEPD